LAFARLGGQGGRIEEKPPERRGKPEREAGALFFRFVARNSPSALE